MSKKKQTIVKRDERGRIVKGYSGNPAGKPCTPKEVRQVMGLTKAMVSSTVAELWEMPIEKLKEIAESVKGTESGRVLVARVMYMAAIRGDYLRMNAILDRAIGKPKEEIIVDVNAKIGISKEVAELSEEELRDIVRNAASQLKRVPSDTVPLHTN